MSSASLVEKRSLKKSLSRNIDTSSTSITSAPVTPSEQSHSKSSVMRRSMLADKSSRYKQRESLPNINAKKASSKSVRASNLELSSSTNDFDDINANRKSQNVPKNSKSLSPSKPDPIKIDDGVLEQLKMDSSAEERNRNQAEREYNNLKHQLEELQQLVKQEELNPTSEYDEAIAKQRYLNETLKAQVAEAKDKLKTLSDSLKTLRSCRKDCNIHMRDLIIDYNCITKGELAKEIKRFQRMEIDLKNNLDRLHWRMDCESKMYHNLIDQYHKLQMDLYYLKNLNSSSTKHAFM